MIWQSTIIMTLFDLAVIAGGVFIALLLYRNRELLLANRSASNLIVIAIGILIVAGFYGADLFVMWGLPSMVGHEESMAAMLFLHTNVSWFVIAVGFGVVTVGLTLCFRSNARQIQALKADEVRDAGLFSEIEASENRFRAFFDNSPAIMFAKDKNHIITFANAKYLKFHQVQETDVCGKRGGTTLGDERRAKVEALDNKVMTEGIAAQLDLQIKSRHGDVRDFLVTKFPIYGAGNEVTGLGTINTDVTERRQYEAKLIAAKTEAENLAAEAEAASRSKSEFIANMSHELRTPLNAVNGFSELLAEEAFGPLGNEEYLKFSHAINESGQHLLSLINDILDISKIEVGSVELSEETFEIVPVIDSCITMIRERAADGGVELIDDISGATLPQLRADKTRIKQVVLNLLTNAVKFTEPGGQVTLKAWHNDDSGFVLQVIDTGIGIAANDIPKALARFQQVEGGLTRRHEGTGLGLPLAKSLVEQHGGSLDLQSQLGIGTTVAMRLPVTRTIMKAA